MNEIKHKTSDYETVKKKYYKCTSENKYYKWNERQEKCVWETVKCSSGCDSEPQGLARSQTLALSPLADTQGSERSPLCKKTSTRFEGQTVIKLGNGLFSWSTFKLWLSLVDIRGSLNVDEVHNVLFVRFLIKRLCFLFNIYWQMGKIAGEWRA